MSPTVTLGGCFPKSLGVAEGCELPKSLWGASQSYFVVFPKATLGCFPKLLWDVFFRVKVTNA